MERLGIRPCMFQAVPDEETDFERFSVRGKIMIAARRWWRERGLREICECSVLPDPAFWTCLFTLFDNLES